jgi:hypothetical protein
MTNRFACVLGSNGPDWDDQLEFAEKDVERIHDTLQNLCGFSVSLAPTNGDAQDAIREVLRVAGLCQPGDDFVIYFSGHGVLHAGRLFLLWRTTSSAIFDSAIPAKQMMEAIELSRAANKLLILDCCHAGGAVGFKGAAVPLEPVLIERGSQLVLCASDKLEFARELQTFEGSFLAFHIANILSSPTKVSISLTDIVAQLRKRAEEHNSANPLEKVPIPFLFGDNRNTFLIKRPSGSRPVEIAISSLYEVDMERFRTTLEPYRRWQGDKIRQKLPVQIALPLELVNRIRVLGDYIRQDEWPGNVLDDTKSRARFLAVELPSELESNLTTAVRTIVAAAYPNLTDNLGAARDAVLESYISAKLFSTARVFATFWLGGERPDLWTEQFEELQRIDNNALIFGLTWVSQGYYPCSFWTDADWTYDGERCRVFIPQKLGLGYFEFLADWVDGAGKQPPSFTQELFWKIIVPQIVDCIIFGGHSSSLEFQLPALMHRKPDYSFVRNLSVRGEAFIETESHNIPDYYDARHRAALIAARKIADHLQTLDDTKRGVELFRLTTLNVLKDIHTEVCKLMPELAVRPTETKEQQD